MGFFRRAPPPKESEAEELPEEDAADEAEDEASAQDDPEQADEGAQPADDEAVAEEEEGAAEDAEEEAIDEAVAEEEDAAAAEEEEAPPIAPRLPREPILTRLRPAGRRVRAWRGWTPTALVLIFVLALFVRSYFYWQEARPDYVDIWLLSGNDPDYHKRSVDYLDANHSQNYFQLLLQDGRFQTTKIIEDKMR